LNLGGLVIGLYGEGCEEGRELKSVFNEISPRG